MLTEDVEGPLSWLKNETPPLYMFSTMKVMLQMMKAMLPYTDVKSPLSLGTVRDSRKKMHKFSMLSVLVLSRSCIANIKGDLFLSIHSIYIYLSGL